MPRLFDLLQAGGGSNSERSQNLPALLDLFRSNATSANRHTAQLGSLYSAPAEPKWDIRSGKPEPGLGQVTPEEWLPPGVGMKLAAHLTIHDCLRDTHYWDKEPLPSGQGGKFMGNTTLAIGRSWPLQKLRGKPGRL